MASLSRRFRIFSIIAASLGCGSSLAAFDSGSTGADGAFAPAADVVVPLPANGVLNYTSINIPAGVTVRFQKNAANTPVTLLVKGDVTIAGTINISGGDGMNPSAPVVLGVTNKGGTGGPGGFNGGMGGAPETNRNASAGLGPGAGAGGTPACSMGVGGGFATATGVLGCSVGPAIAATYGSNTMLPVIGGSGGGGSAGGAAYDSNAGAGGGGGGGALLLVASGSVALTGQILANGGKGGGTVCGSTGGGGAGGMVRILATGYTGAGTISVNGGVGGGTNCTFGQGYGGTGGVGRKSIEVVPNGGSFSAGSLPSLAITAIGGAAVPANPAGSADVTIPMSAGNPLAVTVVATGVPAGTVVKLTLNDSAGGVVSANTSALAGSLQASSASGNIDIPSGSSVLMASTTYTLTLAQGEALSVYALGERVEKVELSAVFGGEQRARLITVSGKTYDVPTAVLALLTT